MVVFYPGDRHLGREGRPLAGDGPRPDRLPPEAADCHAGRRDPQLRAPVPFRGQRRFAVLLRHRRRRPAPPPGGHRAGPAAAGALEGNHPAEPRRPWAGRRWSTTS